MRMVVAKKSCIKMYWQLGFLDKTVLGLITLIPKHIFIFNMST